MAGRVIPTPPIMSRDSAAGQLLYLNDSLEGAIEKVNAKQILDGGAAGLCTVIDPSTGRITGIRVTSTLENGDTLCEVVPVCTGPNCNDVWYCTDTGVVRQQPGPRPSNYVSGPYTSQAKADAACAAPDYTTRVCCAGAPITVPSSIWFSFINQTGWLAGRFPNSFRAPLIPAGLILFTVPGHECDTGSGRGIQFQIDYRIVCGYAGDATKWLVQASVNAGVGDCYCPGACLVPAAPWINQTDCTTSPVQATGTRVFDCGTNWPLASPETVGRMTFPCTAGTFAFDLVVSR